MMLGISASNSWARKASTDASRRRDLSNRTLWAIGQRGCCSGCQENAKSF